MRDILANKQVILSVSVPGRRDIKEDGFFEGKVSIHYGGHLLLATGVKMVGKEVQGIYVHDPRGLEKYQEDTFVPRSVLDRIFSHRTIVVD